MADCVSAIKAVQKLRVGCLAHPRLPNLGRGAGCPLPFDTYAAGASEEMQKLSPACPVAIDNNEGSALKVLQKLFPMCLPSFAKKQ